MGQKRVLAATRYKDGEKRNNFGSLYLLVPGIKVRFVIIICVEFKKIMHMNTVPSKSVAEIQTEMSILPKGICKYRYGIPTAKQARLSDEEDGQC